MSQPFLKIKLADEAVDFIKRFGITPELGMKLAKGLDQSNQRTVDEVKAKLSGPVLKRRSGRLRDSIGRTDAIVVAQGRDKLEISSAVGSGVAHGQAAVRYAAIHEFGGTIPAHRIEAKNARALCFMFKGRKVFVKSVNVPDINMPERSYLRSTIRERMTQYSNRVSRIAIDHWTTNV